MVSTINVELDIFSGRENPKWNLSEDEISQLVNELPKLQYHEKVFSMDTIIYPHPVGYRGFILVPNSIIPSGFKACNENYELCIAEMRVYLWQVFVTEPKGIVRCFEDIPNLEKKLLQMAKEKGYVPKIP